MDTKYNKEKKKILVIAQGFSATGYSRVISSVLGEIAQNFEIHHFAFNYKKDISNDFWKVYPNKIIADYNGYYQLPSLLNKIQPDIIFILHDLYLYCTLKTLIESHNPRPKVVLYCPIDGVKALTSETEFLENVDLLVLYCNFAKEVILESFTRIKSVRKFYTPPIKVIPHGVSLNTFYPLNKSLQLSRHIARKKLFPNRSLDKAFIVLNANRNCLRKRIDITLEAFALFAKNKNNVYLYLHMGMIDQGIDVCEMAKKLGIQDRLLLTVNSLKKPNISDEHLNLIYNACDIGLNTSTGEGWGLVAFEHAATGAVQVIPNHSACSELWQNSGILVPAKQVFQEPNDYVEHRTVVAKDVAQYLNILYYDKKLLIKYSKKCQEMVSQSQFCWENIGKQWRQALYSV